MLKWFFLLICVCYLACVSHSQVFNEVQVDYNINHTHVGSLDGGGLSFYDFNKDGWDDLTLCSGPGNNKFFINNNGEFEEVQLLEGLNDVKSIIWVDYDNDGDADISLTEYNGPFRIFKNDGDLTFTEIEIIDSLNVEVYNTGISWADYDNDGLLDFYVCRYEEEIATNLLFRQSQIGVFQNVTDSLDMGNGHAHSYAATWADFDNDQDIDLFIANDRYSFPNALYSNNGDGTFTDVSEESQIDIQIYSMCSTVGDYDNDGDLDIYNSNQNNGNHLTQNLGDGLFADQFPNTGTEAYAMSWGSSWVDYDNNGWKDLFVCLNLSYEYLTNVLYQNNQDGTFNEIINFSDTIPGNAFCVAKGDLNNDGKYDLMVTYEEPYESRLLLNNTSNDNKFVKLNLTGTISNRDAIGSKIKYYSNGGLQMEYLTCGSDYMSQDSQTKILGLGTSNKIDSLEVIWPSGLIDWHFDIPAGTLLDLVENNTFNTLVGTTSSEFICEDEEITLLTAVDYSDVLWSNGAVGSETIVNAPGEYWATITMFDSFSFNSDTIVISPGYDIDIIDVHTEAPLCFGSEDGQFNITYSSENELAPQNLEGSNLAAGNYFYTLDIENHCSTSVNVIIDNPSELAIIPMTQDATCLNNSDGSLSPIALGGVPEYEFSIFPEFPFDSIPAGTYALFCEDANGCLTEEQFEINNSEELDYELLILGEEETASGGLEVTAVGSTQISSFIILDENHAEQNPNSLIAGQYSVLIIDQYGCEYSDEFEVLFITSIEEFTDVSQSSFYPNPSTGIYYFNSSANLKDIQLLTLEGKLIDKKSYHINSIYLDLRPLAKGTYIVKSINGNEVKTELLILE